MVAAVVYDQDYLVCRSMCYICLVHTGVCKAALGVSQKAVFEDRRC